MLSKLLKNPNFYISIFSTTCFACSELLPFLPLKSNGIIHAIILFLSSYKKSIKKISFDDKKIPKVEAKGGACIHDVGE